MKKERRLRLEVNKISISKLNNIFGAGGGDPVASVDLPCVITTVVLTDIGVDCKTGETRTYNTVETCIGIGSREC